MALAEWRSHDDYRSGSLVRPCVPLSADSLRWTPHLLRRPLSLAAAAADRWMTLLRSVRELRPLVTLSNFTFCPIRAPLHYLFLDALFRKV